MAVTLKDVAKRAGVSFATVSRVVTGRRAVQADVAERVLEAAKALNYVPDRRARSLKLRRSDVIGVIVSDIRQEFIPPVVRAIEDVASERGFAVLLCNADDNRDKELAYADLLLQEGVAGAVIAATADRARGAQRLVDGGIPVVAFDRKPDALAVDSVTVDNRGGAEEAVRQLLTAGYRRIALLAGLQAVGTARERRRGFEAAHAEAGLAVDRELVRDELREAHEATAIAASLLDAPNPPDAFFTTNARLAAGALAALRERNLRLGEDIGFVTFDDPAWALLLERPLSAIAQPTYEIGRAAAEALFARIAGATGPAHHIILPPTLNIRTSMQPKRRSPRRTKRGTP